MEKYERKTPVKSFFQKYPQKVMLWRVQRFSTIKSIFRPKNSYFRIFRPHFRNLERKLGILKKNLGQSTEANFYMLYHLISISKIEFLKNIKESPLIGGPYAQKFIFQEGGGTHRDNLLITLLLIPMGVPEKRHFYISFFIIIG